jgi:hypothetical protein
MITSQTSKPFGVVNAPLLSIDENTATYTVTKELSASIPPEIVAYYTFPGLEQYLELPSAVRNVKNETFSSNANGT